MCLPGNSVVKISQTKKMRIGKALSFAEDLMKKYAKFALDPQAMADDILPSGGTSEAQKKARAIKLWLVLTNNILSFYRCK